MKSVKRGKEWWITEIEGCEDHEDCEDFGPYDTKAEAEDDRQGLVRFEKYGHQHKFWTGDKA